ncbi:eukaryotic translation initiation factor 3 subunit G [[Candida] railenensis]|uniref:Eukaryotic translation initiation factor 3 subunit G n=1 Tax=[Candida] railenensis TaxID=45579 RepID=A0A9P0VXM6_9ASCO|nr:eukaryotic translation initiation factor 3 subunit G [[Candida] railenensis]
MSSVIKSWADAEDEIPQPEVTTNPDGTKTVISYRLNTKGQKVKITQKIKEVKVQERVHPSIAIRKNWSKYGKEKNTPPGPDTRTTQLGEIVELNLGTSWKEVEKQEEEAQEEKKLQNVQRIKCRICGGEHFTSKCPFKDTLGAEAAANELANAEAAAAQDGGDDGSMQNGKYVPRHMRRDASGNLPVQQGRDDSTTLRVSQLNNIVDEDMLRNELFARYGPLQRVTVVRDRDTGDSRGFAYVAFASEGLAEQALNELNGKGYHSLILHLEWSKKKK